MEGYERYEQLKEAMGAEALLEEIIRSMSEDELVETLDFIERSNA